MPAPGPHRVRKILKRMVSPRLPHRCVGAHRRGPDKNHRDRNPVAMQLTPRRHGRMVGSGVIDNPIQMGRLPAQLQEAIPLPARATLELAAMLKTQNIANAASTTTITAVNYAGDEGGIMCRLEIPANEYAVHVSITSGSCSSQRDIGVGP
jgi:hypothetical protein